MGQACRDVVRLKYAEPGVTDNLSLINGEWKDLIMKTCVFFNTIFGKHQFINPTMFRGGKLTEKDLEKMSSGDYRFIVSFSNKNIFRSWNINPALYQVSLVEDQNRWIPGGVGNAVHVVEGEGEASIPYILSGPGAGLEPTTSAMLADFANHCRF
jgi:homoserine dehydrogenase